MCVCTGTWDPDAVKQAVVHKQSYMPRHQEEEEVSVGWWPMNALECHQCHVVFQVV